MFEKLSRVLRLWNRSLCHFSCAVDVDVWLVIIHSLVRANRAISRLARLSYQPLTAPSDSVLVSTNNILGSLLQLCCMEVRVSLGRQCLKNKVGSFWRKAAARSYSDQSYGPRIGFWGKIWDRKTPLIAHFFKALAFGIQS